ncbi:hypothetical protein BU14_0393s0016 [Porphyra umbilicalis]|uniref:Uncharacterized protein n=1 Tax=Porphyra umbilicalis TaxID=2786 RepID=A0A1X6NWE3_PORUM|nr:hypothetical protein BU14_0393s0016 [Porphyra umbilicalis]|eukprot:OSX72928.1 hypothetical protein BU14_0393s0016 [Porphyra umbilicalis]
MQDTVNHGLTAYVSRCLTPFSSLPSCVSCCWGSAVGGRHFRCVRHKQHLLRLTAGVFVDQSNPSLPPLDVAGRPCPRYYRPPHYW